LAHVSVSKYADHCPLFRQSQIYARSGLNIDRSTLANWMGKVSFHLALVVDQMFKELKRSGKLFADETRCPVLDPRRGKTKTGYLWAIARDERLFGGTAPPGVVFCYADGRGGKHAQDVIWDRAALGFVLWLFVGETQLCCHLGDGYLAGLQCQLKLLKMNRSG
jgi:transposase